MKHLGIRGHETEAKGTKPQRYVAANAGVSGTVFDIKRFATGDGPGVRGLVFLKGCPLRCAWCANPESQNPKPEILFYENKCVRCGLCVRICPQQAIRTDETFGLVVDRSRCNLCGQCVTACLHEARKLVGETKSVADVLSIIRRDRRYYDLSGGGVTLTGGEPLLQIDFCRELLKACKAEDLHTAIETSGYAPLEDLMSVLPYLDLLLYDLKHIEPERHLQGTGESNEQILANLEQVARAFDHGEIVVRVPLIVGYNSSEEIQSRIYRFVRALERVDHVEVIPYHRFGMLKYAGLGRRYALHELAPVHRSDLSHLVALGASCGVEVRIDAT